VSRVDLDESTGRFLFVADYSTTLEEIESACRIYLAGFPDWWGAGGSPEQVGYVIDYIGRMTTPKE